LAKAEDVGSTSRQFATLQCDATDDPADFFTDILKKLAFE